MSESSTNDPNFSPGRDPTGDQLTLDELRSDPSTFNEDCGAATPASHPSITSLGNFAATPAQPSVVDQLMAGLDQQTSIAWILEIRRREQQLLPPSFQQQLTPILTPTTTCPVVFVNTANTPRLDKLVSHSGIQEYKLSKQTNTHLTET